LILEAQPRPAAVTGLAAAPANHVGAALARSERFADRYRSITAACRTNLERLVNGGKTVGLWGGGSKAVSFLTSLDVGHLIQFSVDINPNKQGKFLIGTGHPVLGPEQLREYPALYLVVMNPVYVPEITQTLDQLDVRAEITTVNELLTVHGLT